MLMRLVKRFSRDESGAFALIFGVMAIVLVAMAGAVVDYVRIDQVRNQAQIALDAAALALQPTIYTDSATTIRDKAEPLLKERLPDPSLTIKMPVSDVSIDTTNGELRLSTDITIPMAFVSLVGVDTMTINVASQVTRKKLNLEVAMVLDNSGSMAQESRMTNLKTAATCATNILFYGTCNPTGSEAKAPNTKVGIIPFNFFVNIGASNATQSWIDKAGNSFIANDNFDDDDNETTTFNKPVDRLQLFKDMGVAWAGCTEARPYPYNVDDTTPDTLKPETLYVPELAPDEPGSAGGWEYGFPNSYINDSPHSCDKTTTCSCTTKTETGWYWCGYDWCWGDHPVTDCKRASDNGSCSCSWGASSCPYTYSPTGLSKRELQERMCKYKGGGAVRINADRGPNSGCPTTSILPLTDNSTSIINRIKAMVALGATNIQQGIAWGFRVLSPTEPFTEGGPYDQATSKVLIVMTDGENTYYDSSNMNGTDFYSPYGYLWDSTPTNPRVGAYGSATYADINDNYITMEAKTNTLTEETCTNAKKVGITIYTIGLKPPNDTTKNMLKNCASSQDKAYFPDDPSKLNTVFAAIAEQLAQLRIEK